MQRRYWIAAILSFSFVSICGAIWICRRESPPPTPAPEHEATTVSKHEFELPPADWEQPTEPLDIAIDSQDRIYLAWAASEKVDQRTLFLSISNDGGASFSEPKVVSRSAVHEIRLPTTQGEMNHRIGMNPHLASSGENLTVAWTQSVSENATVCLVSIATPDGGESFSSPISINQSLDACPNFTSLAAWLDQRVYCWLDRREQKRQLFTALMRGPEVPLESAAFSAEAKERACQCCPTVIAFDSKGQLVVAFRDADRIMLARGQTDTGSFESVVQVAEVISPADRCGHEGPSLAIDGDHLHLTWTDAKSGVPRVQYASANLENSKFEILELDPTSKSKQGNCRLKAAGGQVHAVWEAEPLAEEFISIGQADPPDLPPVRSIMYAQIAPASRKFGPARKVDDNLGVNQSHPAIAVASAGDVFVAWHETHGQSTSVVVKKLTIK